MDKEPVIGIGITTRNRPGHLSTVLKQISKYWKPNQKIVIVDDASEGGEEANVGVVSVSLSESILVYDSAIYFYCQERMGIAKAKNKCLLELQDLYKCDYFFLLDDDVFPIKDGWCEMYINAHKITKENHFLYLRPQGVVSQESSMTQFDAQLNRADVEIFDNCQGCFMFMTKKVIEKVGGMNKDYGVYGYEHASYSQRVRAAKLNKYGTYLHVSGAEKYIYAMDLDRHLTQELNLKLLYKDDKLISSMSSEMDKLPGYLKHNLAVYRKDKTIYQPLE